MSQIAATSWLKLLLGGHFFAKYLFGRNGIGRHDMLTDSESYFKEQALRFGYDTREIKLQAILSKPWQSFFFEKSLEYTLKGVSCKTNALSLFEKIYWKRHCRHVESITLSGHAMTLKDAALLFSWLENLKILELFQTNGLIQTHDKIPTLSKSLDTVCFKDLHLLDEHAHRFIPDTVRCIHIDRCRSVTLDFFEGLKRLKNLESFTFSRSKTLQAAMLQKLPATLKTLDLTDSAENVDPTILELLPKNLESLTLNGWHNTDEAHLPTLCHKLKTLELSTWKLTTSGLDALKDLKLEELNLAHCFHDAVLERIETLPKTLKKLNLSHNTIDTEALTRLRDFEALETLLLEHVDTQDLGVHVNFPKTLQYLSLSYSGSIAKECLSQIKILPKLCVLELAGCTIDNEALQALPKNLRELNLCDCATITDIGIQYLEENQELHTLLVNGCEQIRGFGLGSLTNSLKILSVQGCDRLSGKCFVMLPRELEALYLDRCELISGADIHMLPKTLQVLSLSHCVHVDAEAMDVLKTLPFLHTLDVRACPQITHEDLAFMLKKRFEGLIIFSHEVNSHDPAKQSCKDLEQHPAFWMLQKTTIKRAFCKT